MFDTPQVDQRAGMRVLLQDAFQYFRVGSKDQLVCRNLLPFTRHKGNIKEIFFTAETLKQLSSIVLLSICLLPTWKAEQLLAWKSFHVRQNFSPLTEVMAADKVPLPTSLASSIAILWNRLYSLK